MFHIGSMVYQDAIREIDSLEGDKRAERIIRASRTCYLSDNYFEEGIWHLRKHGKYLEASKYAETQGKRDLAINLAECAGDVDEAARIAKRTSWSADAVEVYMRHGRYDDAIRVVNESRMSDFTKYPMLAEIYERAGKFKQAANFYSLFGDRRNQVKCLDRAGSYQKAAYIAEELGDINYAIRLFELARNPFSAATVARESGQVEIALLILELKSESSLLKYAARIAFEEGMLERAVRNYERAGEFRKAIGICGIVGDLKRAEEIGKRADLSPFQINFSYRHDSRELLNHAA